MLMSVLYDGISDAGVGSEPDRRSRRSLGPPGSMCGSVGLGVGSAWSVPPFIRSNAGTADTNTSLC